MSYQLFIGNKNLTDEFNIQKTGQFSEKERVKK